LADLLAKKISNMEVQIFQWFGKNLDHKKRLMSIGWRKNP